MDKRKNGAGQAGVLSLFYSFWVGVVIIIAEHSLIVARSRVKALTKQRPRTRGRETKPLRLRGSVGKDGCITATLKHRVVAGDTV